MKLEDEIVFLAQTFQDSFPTQFIKVKYNACRYIVLTVRNDTASLLEAQHGKHTYSAIIFNLS